MTDGPLITQRRQGIDLARGVALIGMAIFHLGVDLEMFGVTAPGTMTLPGWTVFARLVAGSFVLLAGVSLVLAHHRGLRPDRFLRGTATIALAAAGVTLATLLAIPEAFVFFGILHLIVLARLLGLAFVRAPVALMVIVAALVWVIPYIVTFAVFDTRALAWIGFAQVPPLSMDLEPLFPWFAPFLLGMVAARLMLRHGFEPARPTASAPRPARALAWAGRHSLAIYLLHQPVLLGLLWLLVG